MSLTILVYIAADLITLAILVGILYAPRHSRKDLMAAYIGANVGVLAVTLLLSVASVVAGLGLGFFGVLFIIHLHLTKLTQHEIVYFFAALAPGLLGGIQTTPIGIVAILTGTIIAALWTSDHPALMHHNRHQVTVLDHAITSETVSTAYLRRTLGGQVSSVKVQRFDLVDDTTTIGVHFRMPHHAPAGFETVMAFDDIAPAAQPTTEPAGAVARKAQTAQLWSGTCLNTAQAGSHPRPVEAQPLTVVPAAQYVIRSSSQMISSAAMVSR